MKKMKLLAGIAASAICSGFLTNCNKNKDFNEIVDCSGATVRLKTNIDKIICVDQSCCAFLVAMQKTDKIIGVHGSIKFSNWSPVFLGDELNHMQKYGYQPSAEAIYESGADLVILNDAKYAEELRKVDIPAIYFGYSNMEELFSAVNMLDKIFGSSESDFSKQWKNDVEGTINNIKRDLSPLKDAEKRNVYYINASNNPSDLYSTFGGDSFCEYWLNNCGANLVTSDYKNITSIESEIIIGKNPDTIVIGGYAEYSRKDELKSDSLWADIDAVKNDEIYLLPTSFVSYEKYSLELPLLFSYTANALYPSLHSFDAKESLKAFYKKYYRLDLSDEILDNLYLGLYPDGSRMDA